MRKTDAAAEARIAYRELGTPIGRMVAAATSRGCCLLEFEDRGGLERIKQRILKRYGSVMVKSESPFLDQIERELKEYFDGTRAKFDVALDIKGTPFQRAVWEQLFRIPYGETRTYGEVARHVGKPRAVRAVGKANGDNCISLAVPCHRVIQRDGELRGYGGGLWRKKYLLELERGTRPSASKPS